MINFLLKRFEFVNEEVLINFFFFLLKEKMLCHFSN